MYSYSELALRFSAEVDKRAECAYHKELEENKLLLYLDDLDRAAGKLWDQLQEFDPEWYGADNNHYSCQMKSVIRQIPRDIESDWALSDAVIEQIGTVIRSAGEKGGDTLWARLRFYVQWKLGMQMSQPTDGIRKTLDAMVQDEADSILRKIIDDLMRTLDSFFEKPPEQIAGDPAKKLWQQLDYLCYMFRETFADLQAILLLDMR